jgi:hypothetical protein
MFTEAETSTTDCSSLLAEVDFKWLMAGQGQWVDLCRFHDDVAYATGLMDWALASPSFALRASAEKLKTHAPAVMATTTPAARPAAAAAGNGPEKLGVNAKS